MRVRARATRSARPGHSEPAGGYGDATAFRLGLNHSGLHYVVSPPRPPPTRPPPAPPYSGTGWPPVAKYPEPACSVKALVVEAGRGAARPVSWRDGSRPGKGRPGHKRMDSRFVALRIRPAGREIREATVGVELAESWLLAEWSAGEPEPVQFWLSDLPENTPLTTLVRLAKLRWRIEHDYRELKQPLGLVHFEGRSFNGWHHLVTLASLTHAFCTLRRLATAPKAAAPVRACMRSSLSCNYSPPPGPAPAPPATGTYPNRDEPYQALPGHKRQTTLAKRPLRSWRCC
ncbi:MULTISPECIES: transposase [unclassified Streptomyces]|uniref:transposase n=1 Tax=unclassified Streptomyces TaxID=2593676 RepID=UPI003FA3AD44